MKLPKITQVAKRAVSIIRKGRREAEWVFTVHSPNCNTGATNIGTWAGRLGGERVGHYRMPRHHLAQQRRARRRTDQIPRRRPEYKHNEICEYGEKESMQTYIVVYIGRGALSTSTDMSNTPR